MATIDTGFNQGFQPETIHAGINCAVLPISLSVSWSSGDVHRIGKLPNRAIYLDSVFYPGTALGAAAVAKFGTSASNDMFFASASYSQAAAAIYRCTRRLGFAQQLSLSDDARVLYDNVTMVATAGVSIGYIGDLLVFYKMPGQVP